MIPYEVIRSGRRTLGLEVTGDGRVLVRSPGWVPDEEIRRFVDRHQDWISRSLEKRRQALERRPEPTEEELVRLTGLAASLLPARVDHFSRIMGLRPTGVKITRARTRFGSCSGKNSICFSCLLMRYPQEAIDYVVVHELAHIRHKNHSPQFWQTVAEVLPDYRARRAMLRD